MHGICRMLWRRERALQDRRVQVLNHLNHQRSIDAVQGAPGLCATRSSQQKRHGSH
jgi:hypothetical protein